jgi:hypothetical protein
MTFRPSPWLAPLLVPVLLLAAPGCGSQKPAAAPEHAPSPARAEEGPAGASDDLKFDGAAEAEAPAPAGQPAQGAAPEMPGSSRKAGSAPRDEASANGDIERLAGQLEATLRLAAPDCTTAWSLRDRICDLSDRICDLADRSAEPEVRERCTDGKIRCERATARVRTTCAD